MPSKRVALLFENFPSDYPVNLHRDYLRILNKLMRLWDTSYFDHYMSELLINSRDRRNGFAPEVVNELLFINRLHEAFVQKGMQLPPEMDWRSLPHNCYSPESFAAIVRKEPVETICSCLDQNISVDIRFGNGSTPLIVAAEEGRLDVVEFLVDSGANLNARNDHNYTALHWAAYHGHQDIVEFLIKNKADANIKDSTGSTPLQLAIVKGHVLIAGLLISYGTRVDKATLIDIANRKGMSDIVKILRMQPDGAC